MISRGSSCVPQKKPLLLKPYSEIYRQRHLKHFPYRQGINISVTLSVQLHWHWPFKKTHYPSKSTTTLAIWTLCWFRILAKLWAFNFGHPCPSLVKGRWIDGKAQALILLLSACDMSTLFMLQTFLPSRRRDCLPLHWILLPSQPLQKDNTPSLRTKLASPNVSFCCSVKPSQLRWGL